MTQPWPVLVIFGRLPWEAEDLRAGGWHERKYRHIYRALDSLDEEISEEALVDPNGYDKVVERRLMLDSLDCHLREEGLTEIRQVYKLLQWGYSWEHIAKQLGEADGEPIRKRYSRWVKRMTLRHNPQ